MSAFVETGTILDRILARTTADVEERKRHVGLAALDERAKRWGRPRSLRASLAGPGLAVIAEIKRASPSKGRFPVEFEIDELAESYVEGAAAAISVLTDEPFFQGSLADLERVGTIARRHDLAVPVLRKDFVVDEYQIAEALAFGADAVLLIVAALSQERLVGLQAEARRAGLDALVEVHDEAEMARAAAAGATLIGINNRNLRTFHVDLAVTERLAPIAPAGAVLVGESGIFTAADAARMVRAGVDAVLVGESLILAGDRGAAIAELVGAGDPDR